MMKKSLVLSLTLLLCFSSAAYAESHGHRLSIGVGAAYGDWLGTSISYEFESRHHNAVEVAATGFLHYDDCPSCGHVCPESFWHNYNLFSAGVAWKPCVLTRKNSWGNLRLGAGIGTTGEDVVPSILLGYERNYALRSGCSFFWQLRTDVLFNSTELFRPGAFIGFKFPIYKNAL